MAGLSDIFTAGAAGLKPKLVITSPDGSAVWIDVAPSAPAAGSSQTLWPEGYTADLRFGDAPSVAGVTTSPAGFALAQSPTLATRRGPLGLPWGLWLLAAAGLIVAPWLILAFRRK